MKKIFLSAFLTLISVGLHAQTVPVTFHLDANNTQYQTVKMWNSPNTYSYTDEDGDRIFELTLDLQPGKFDYHVMRDNAWGWDPDNPLYGGIYPSDGASMNISDPMISYLLPKDNDMLRENRIQADFAYTASNPPLANSISVTINGNSIINPSQYFNATKRQLYIANPPYLVNGSNTVTVAYSTNKGSISRSSTFSHQPIKLMIDTMVYRMEHILGWGRVFQKPYPASVYLKCNDKTYTATVNSEGYFGADIDILNGENLVKVAYSEAGLTNPTDQMKVNAEIRAKWWVELTGSISGSTATIQAVAHDINQSELTFSWSQSEDNPAGLSVSGSSPNLTFNVPTQAGNYEIELHVTATNGDVYIARKMLTTKERPHFIGVNERAPWMETMVLYEIEADFFDWGKFSFQNIKKTFQHIKELGANAFRITPFVSGGFISWDHFEIYPPYGSIDDLKDMIETAHQYGIKVLFDVPLSHTAPFHPFILPNFLLKEKAEPYYDFSLWKGNPGESDIVNSPDNGRQCVYTNLENGYTQEYFTRLMEYWVEVAGADGFRIDCGQESINRSPDYVKYLHKRLRNINPDLFILEEGENRGHPAVDYYDFGDAVYDWKLYGWNNSEGFPGIFSGTYSVDQLHELLTTGTPDSGLVMRYINTGYFDYFSKRFGAEQERSGVAVITTTLGLPNIRGGEEVGLERANGMYDMTDSKGVMPFYTRLIKARKELLGNYPAIERITQNIPEKVYAYTAKSNGKIVMTVVNFSASQTNVTIDLANPVFENKGKTNWYNIVDDVTADNSSKTTLTIALAPWKAEVFAINCTKDDVFPAAESIVLNTVTGENSIETNGGSLNFMVLIYPENSMDSIIWGLEGDTLLATLSNGTLTACGCGEGEVTVIARSEKNPTIEARKTIQIKNQFSGQVSNSTFDNNVNDWFLWSPGCNSRFEWDNGEGHLIYNNGSTVCNSQLMTSNNMTVVSGKKYRVRFDARATGNSTVKCMVRKNGDGYGSLSAEPEFQITTANKSFEFEFVAVTSSAIAQLQFNVGGGNAGFWFDNVSFCEIFESDSVNVTFRVDMQYEEISPNGVFVKGNWDDWTSGEKMENTSKKIYSATIPVLKNFSLNYKFYNGDPDGEWSEMKGEDFHGECTDEWANRIFNVEETDTVIDPVCFESCNICQPVNPAQQLSKGVGFPLVFDVSSPYDIQFNYYTIEDFRNLKKLGINTIRLAFTRATLFEGNSIDPSPLFFYLLDHYVDMAEAEGINLVLAFGELFDYANDPTIQDKLIKVWTAMSEHYKDRSTRLFYELNNEPNGLSDESWGQIQGKVIDAIREIDQTHTLIVTPIWGSLTNLDKLPDYEDDNLIYTFHFYDPFLFTHQGCELATLTEFVGVPFPYNEEEMPPMPASFVGGYYEWLYNKYETDATAEAIKDLINTAVKFKNDRNVPLWCGEFGVVGPADHDEKVYWYRVLRTSLEENGIPWSLLGYTHYTGPFEEGTYHLFDHDFDIPVVEALGLVVPPQTDLNIEAETEGFDIYKDYPSPNIHSWISNTEGTTHLLSEEEPYEGKFCIYTEDFPIWSLIDFQFEPHRDLSELVANDYILEFRVKGDTPGAKFNVRFMDTDTSDPNDHPWRIVHDVDETMAAWDGEWHLIQIPLSEFVEQGTFEEVWHNPEGKFDWKAIGYFQIFTEFHSFEGMKFWFDNIRIVEGQQIDSVNVTFRVDMQNEVVSSSGIHLNGSFCNWTPANAAKLTAAGSVYSTTIQLKKGETIEYKFVNGASEQWTQYETLNGLECEFGNDANRGFVVPDEDFVLDLVCFGSCGVCLPVVVSDSVGITFQVNLQNETVSPNGVYIMGNWDDWTTAVKLDNTTDKIYSTTLTIKPGNRIDYKFFNGNPAGNWGEYKGENFLGSCTDEWTNRFLIVPNESTVLNPVCFNSCEMCEPVVVSDSVDVTFRVDMSNETVSDKGVHIGGGFESIGALSADGTVYSATIKLKKGETLSYKFINGELYDWAKYETIIGTCTTGDADDRWLLVPANDVTLDVVCFGSCGECEPVVVSDSVNVTFRVDMSNETVSAAGVNVNGSFSNWSTAKPMHLFSGGVVYATSLKLKKGETIQYKFINGGTSDWNKYELIDGICAYGNDKNRMLVVPNNDVTLDVVCFGKCIACTFTLPADAGKISGETSVCQGQSSVTYTVPTISDATSYIWSLPEGATGTSNTNSISVSFGASAVSGNITVKGHNSTGDGASSTLSITVNTKPPTPVISQNGELLHSNATNGNQWYNQTGSLTGATNQNYSPKSSGDYYVIVSVNGCTSNPSNSLHFIPVGIDFARANKAVKVYPNPVTNELIIEIEDNTQKIDFDLINSIGQVVFSGVILEKSVVQAASFPSGMYLIKLKIGNTFEFKKFIKK